MMRTDRTIQVVMTNGEDGKLHTFSGVLKGKRESDLEMNQGLDWIQETIERIREECEKG